MREDVTTHVATVHHNRTLHPHSKWAEKEIKSSERKLFNKMLGCYKLGIFPSAESLQRIRPSKFKNDEPVAFELPTGWTDLSLIIIPDFHCDCVRYIRPD